MRPIGAAILLLAAIACAHNESPAGKTYAATAFVGHDIPENIRGALEETQLADCGKRCPSQTVNIGRFASSEECVEAIGEWRWKPPRGYRGAKPPTVTQCTARYD